MEHGSLNLSEIELAASTIMSLNNRDDRRVIDNKDIREYKQALIKQGRKNSVLIRVIPSSFEEEHNFNLYVKKVDDKYLMLPYTTTYDLFSNILMNVNSRVIALTRNEEFIYNLPKRNQEEINNMESLLDNSFQKTKKKH